MSDFVPWLRELAENGGKGVVNNIDARCLGRIADEIEKLRGALELARKRIEYFGSITDERHQEANGTYFLPPINAALALSRPHHESPTASAPAGSTPSQRPPE